ncbi:MAG: glucosamine-6-phosphate deaminase [Promethearchaeota archaeon]|nr:MAG: glucosamine-6-phosphate deaminase [Candidatus Lokiarchaeota archaeon]
MNIHIFSDKAEMGREAAKKATEILLSRIQEKGHARFIMATGVSQYDFLGALVKMNIPWEKTEMFHLDEYMGISADHPASFRKYLNERFIDIVKHPNVNLIQGNSPNSVEECKRVGDLLNKDKIDIAFIGIGENGHIAFNDPPADFKTEDPYIVVELDEKCRQQQVGEGWFRSIDEVPTHAISMSVKQILKAEYIICICPDSRKQKAVYETLHPTMPITPDVPASILKSHRKVDFYLDDKSAKLLF